MKLKELHIISHNHVLHLFLEMLSIKYFARGLKGLRLKNPSTLFKQLNALIETINLFIGIHMQERSNHQSESPENGHRPKWTEYYEGTPSGE